MGESLVIKREIKTVKIIITMGKSYSKNEEIIIAQNGANQLDFTNIESHVKMYGIIILVIGLIILAVILCKCCVKCRSFSKKWMDKNMEKSIKKFQEAQLQSVIYENRAS